jgi:HPt (histidine-containing phosphotransfer) domain-containing protein
VAAHALGAALDSADVTERLIIAEQLAHDLPPENFRRIVETFEDDLGRLAGQLEQAGSAGNLDGYRRAAHSLAGAAAAVGAVLLERTARIAMEHRPDMPPAQMIPLIREQAAAALRELAALAAKVGDSQPGDA